MSGLTVVSFVISGMLLGTIIWILCYGAAALPSAARLPLHYGLGAYTNFASKTTGRPAG